MGMPVHAARAAALTIRRKLHRRARICAALLITAEGFDG
jgi:hypothetical protein